VNSRSVKQKRSHLPTKREITGKAIKSDYTLTICRDRLMIEAISARKRRKRSPSKERIHLEKCAQNDTLQIVLT
jgi:hypothetical protein